MAWFWLRPVEWLTQPCTMACAAAASRRGAGWAWTALPTSAATRSSFFMSASFARGRSAGRRRFDDAALFFDQRGHVIGVVLERQLRSGAQGVEDRSEIGAAAEPEDSLGMAGIVDAVD